MVAAQHVADAGSGFLELLVGGKAVLVQRVEYAAVDRLESVAHVRQGAADDDRHGVVDVAVLHFADQLGFRYYLIRKQDVLRLIVSFMCHLFSP